MEEEEEDEEDEGEEECEEEEDQIEEDDVTPTIIELTRSEATVDNDLIESPKASHEDTNVILKVNEKPVVAIKTPSPTKKIRKPKPEQKPKKFKIKKSEIMVDPDLDHEIANLMETNLKNQAHTLRFSRLMVRAKMLSARSQLLSILRSGELACRRLFLDYHGLKLLHTWMCDPVTNNVQQEWSFRLDILETLEVLPIPNKNMLQDSKVLVIVRKWAQIESIKENVKSPEESPSDSGSGTPISEGSSPKVEDAKIVDSSKSENVEHSKVSDSVDIDDLSSKKVSDSLKEITDSPKDVIEVADSSKEITESSKELADSLKDVTDSLKEITDSTKEITDSTKEITDSSKDITDLSKDITDSSKEATDSSKEATDLPKEITDSSKEITDSSKGVSKAHDVIESDSRNNAVVVEIQPKSGEESADDELMEQIRYMTSKLLESWEQLKEVFRIPKKLRIEQMKEHEQEANRITDSEDSNKRYSDAMKEKEKDRFKKEKRNRPIEANDPDSVFLKVQRRRLFEAQQSQQSIDKRNNDRQIEAIHVAKCKYFQLDPRVTSYRDIPFSVSPLTGQWYSKDGEMIATPPSHVSLFNN